MKLLNATLIFCGGLLSTTVFIPKTAVANDADSADIIRNIRDEERTKIKLLFANERSEIARVKIDTTKSAADKESLIIKIHDNYEQKRAAVRSEARRKRKGLPLIEQ